MKALVISVGTGTRPTKHAVRSLAKALSYSIKHHNPDKTFFIVTEQSQKRPYLKYLKLSLIHI